MKKWLVLVVAYLVVLDEPFAIGDGERPLVQAAAFMKVEETALWYKQDDNSDDSDDLLLKDTLTGALADSKEKMSDDSCLHQQTLSDVVIENVRNKKNFGLVGSW